MEKRAIDDAADDSVEAAMFEPQEAADPEDEGVLVDEPPAT